jgi:hypothetical protein
LTKGGSAMPSRSLSLAILAFWLATMGWMFVREFWPRSLQPDSSLADLIDLEDEANSLPAHWLVFKGNERIGTARSEAKYRQMDGTYELHVEYRFDKWSILIVAIHKMTSMERITAQGALRETTGKVVASVGGLRLEISAGGVVQDGELRPHLQVRPVQAMLPLLQPKPMRVSEEESVLNPMQPFHRLHNLYEGRKGQMALANQLANAVPDILPKEDGWTGMLDVTVHGEAFVWNDRKVPCWLISYQKDGKEVGRTWVRQQDGRVLQQEAEYLGTRLTLRRKADR